MPTMGLLRATPPVGAVEGGVAEGEDAAVGGDEPVALAVGGGGHADQGRLLGRQRVEAEGSTAEGHHGIGDAARLPMCGTWTDVVETDALEVARVGAQEIMSIARINNAAAESRHTDRHPLDLLTDEMISHSIDAGHALPRCGRGGEPSLVP